MGNVTGNRANGRKSIFITGAASGMGRETAKLFSANGWFVGGYDQNEEGLRSLAAELGADNCVVRRLDVTDRGDYAKAIEEFGAATEGKLDLLYNNAGIGRGGPYADMSWDDVMAVVNVNFIAVLSGINLALPLLKATANSLCFSTSSSSATFGMANIAVYSATKHAVKGLTEALSVEFKAYGVRAADTLPGVIDTPILPPGMTEVAAKEGTWRLMAPRAVAEAVWAAYHGDKVHYYVPEELYKFDQDATRDPESVRDKIAAMGALFFLQQG